MIKLEFDFLEPAEEHKVPGWASTGSGLLNWAISGSAKKGIPLGRVTELFGSPATGKSFLSYHILGSIQKQGGIAILDDTELAYDPSFGTIAGIENNQLLLLHSSTVSEHFEHITKLIEEIYAQDNDATIVIVLDSMALLSTNHELETDFGIRDMTKAQEIRKLFRKLLPHMKHRKLGYVVTNHETHKIGGYGGRVTTGGTGSPYQASVRVELSVAGYIHDNKKDVIGVQVRFSVTKNKVALPFREGTIDLFFTSGIDETSGILEVAAKTGAVIENKGWFEYKGKKYRAKELLSEHGQELIGLLT